MTGWEALSEEERELFRQRWRDKSRVAKVRAEQERRQAEAEMHERRIRIRAEELGWAQAEEEYWVEQRRQGVRRPPAVVPAWRVAREREAAREAAIEAALALSLSKLQAKGIYVGPTEET